MSGVLAQVIPELSTDRLAVLTGPSFAKEVARKMATVVTVASIDPNTAAFVQQVFVTPYFRVYTIDDVVGAELGAAVKKCHRHRCRRDRRAGAGTQYPCRLDHARAGRDPPTGAGYGVPSRELSPDWPASEI